MIIIYLMKDRMAIPVIFSASAAFNSSWATALVEHSQAWCFQDKRIRWNEGLTLYHL